MSMYRTVRVDHDCPSKWGASLLGSMEGHHSVVVLGGATNVCTAFSVMNFYTQIYGSVCWNPCGFAFFCVVLVKTLVRLVKSESQLARAATSKLQYFSENLSVLATLVVEFLGCLSHPQVAQSIESCHESWTLQRQSYSIGRWGLEDCKQHFQMCIKVWLSMDRNG